MDKAIGSNLTRGVKGCYIPKFPTGLHHNPTWSPSKPVTWEDLEINTPSSFFCSCYPGYVNLLVWHDIHCGKLVQCIYYEYMFIRCYCSTSRMLKSLVRESRHITDYRFSNRVDTQPRFAAGSCLYCQFHVIRCEEKEYIKCTTCCTEITSSTHTEETRIAQSV